MPSYTVSLTGNSSTLRTSLFPALRLQRNKLYEVALLDFTTYNSIPNITNGVNSKLCYYDNEILKEVSLSTGSYEVEDINKAFQNLMGKDNIEVKANHNLLRVELISSYKIDFSKPESIGSTLGFPTSVGVLNPNVLHTGPDIVNINKVNTLNISCNIVDGSYKNGEKQHVLHTFYPSVPPGFMIVERPHNLVYLPLNSTYISDIVVNVSDQHGNNIDFRGEHISLRLHIKSA